MRYKNDLWPYLAHRLHQLKICKHGEYSVYIFVFCFLCMLIAPLMESSMDNTAATVPYICSYALQFSLQGSDAKFLKNIAHVKRETCQDIIWPADQGCHLVRVILSEDSSIFSSVDYDHAMLTGLSKWKVLRNQFCFGWFSLRKS